jgi:hypothetical protein
MLLFFRLPFVGKKKGEDHTQKGKYERLKTYLPTYLFSHV